MDILSEIEGAIADAFSALSVVQSTLAAAQSTVGAAQATLMESQYLMAIPLIAAEFKGLTHVLEGSGRLFIGTIESLGFFIPDFFNGTFTFFTFALSWMMCLFKNISNMQTCIFYYLLEAFGQILYLIPRIILWLIFQLGFDPYPIEKGIWDKIDDLDKIVMKYAGFHICHYPKNIRDLCYNCRRLKVNTLIKHASPLVTDITERLPSKLMPGIQKIAQGGDELMHPFQ